MDKTRSGIILSTPDWDFNSMQHESIGVKFVMKILVLGVLTEVNLSLLEKPELAV